MSVTTTSAARSMPTGSPSTSSTSNAIPGVRPRVCDGKDSTAGPDGDPPYDCDWSGEWDIVPGQDIAVMYVEPDDGDRVINVFWEPAPDLSVGKGPEGHNEFVPGGQAVFWINYRNEGDAVADPRAPG